MIDIYFDNAATTKTDDDVIECMKEFNERFYSNPAAMHRFGFQVEKEIKKANNDFCKIINANDDEVIWTSGGTESNNLAIFGFVYAHRKEGNSIITTKIEHPSVSNVFKKLESDGFRVTYLNVDKSGHIDIKELENSISDDTLLVSIMTVNNEIGSLQNIEEIANVIKNKNNKTIFHTDFVQAFGKIKIDCKKQKVDLLSISSHKFHGPKGVGCLYKNKNVRISPLLYGGGQQMNLRSGTLNTLGIIGTAYAANKAYSDFDKNYNHFYNLKKYLIDKLYILNEKHNIININSLFDESFAPHIISVSFKNIRAEVLLHALDEYGIYVSAGSACSSHDNKISDTLSAIGLKSDMLQSTIRISFGKYNNISEIDTFINTLDTILPKLCIKKI